MTQPQSTDETNIIHQGSAFDVVPELPDDHVDAVITSPPYWGLRDYQIDGQLGLEEKAKEYITKLADLSEYLFDVVTPRGSVWVNIGDTYNGCSLIRKSGDFEEFNPNKGDKGYEKQLQNHPDGETKRRSTSQFNLSRRNKLLIPSRVAMEMQNRGWILRDRVIWNKKTAKPEGRVQSRLRQSHETIFRFVQQEDNIFKRDDLPHDDDVWELRTSTVNHPAPMPQEIPRRCIRATTHRDATVLDPFCGSGTVCDTAQSMGRDYVGIEVKPEFVDMARANVGTTPDNGLSRWLD